MTQPAVNHKSVNLWTSRIIPAILIGIVGYVTWVVLVRICVGYLLQPPNSLHAPRHGAAVAAIVLYLLTLFLMALSYFRLLFTVATNPGYVPRGPQWHAQRAEGVKQKRRSSTGQGVRDRGQKDAPSVAAGRTNEVIAGYAYAGPGELSSPEREESAPGLQDFFSKDVFVCQGDGRPIWCSSCLNWKPDRTHHCREIDRCVRKMDHFCPWVGGVVSETSFKFFIQFVGWATVYCFFNLILMAILIAEYHKDKGTVDVNSIVTVGFAALFGLFALGMTGSSLQFAFINTTTIENLSRKSIVWQLAVHVPNTPSEPASFPIITYSTAQRPLGSSFSEETITPNANKAFAILHSKPGENPWDLGLIKNFKTVMGEHWYDWLLPIKYSPCCNHESGDSQFAIGPVLNRIRKDAGISTPARIDEKPHRRHRHRSRRRTRRHSNNTNEIVSEKHTIQRSRDDRNARHNREDAVSEDRP